MQEVAHELHAIRQAHKEVMEGQRSGFQMELEKVKEGFQNELEKVKRELYQVELHSTMLEYKMNTRKDQKQILKSRPSQDILAIKNAQIISSSDKPLKEKESINPPHKSYAQIAVSS